MLPVKRHQGTRAPKSFAIGSRDWPGLSKLNEECGELVQVIGKLLATGGSVEHWEGEPLDERLTDELADVQAAIHFVLEHNGERIDRERWRARVVLKLSTFNQWHQAQRNKR